MPRPRRPVLSGFVRAHSHPLAIAIVAAASLAVLYGLGIAFRAAFAAGIGPALGAVMLVLVAGRAWRALALATALPRVTLGTWPQPATLAIRACRLLALDAIEGALCSALAVAALVVVIGSSRGPLALALGLSPMLWLALATFATFRVATLSIAASGASLGSALGTGISCALQRPGELLALQSWLFLALIPLGVAAAAARAPLPWAAASAAAVLWAYASLHEALRPVIPTDERSSSSPGGDGIAG